MCRRRRSSLDKLRDRPPSNGRDYINKILYTHTTRIIYRYLSSYRGTAKSVARVNGVYIYIIICILYILSNDQTTGVEKIINNSWTLQRRGICAHAYNTSTKKRKISLCTYNTAIGTSAVVRMRNGVIMQITSEESL